MELDTNDQQEDDKPEATINTNNDAKDDCSDLTDNNHETDEQAPKSFPQKVRDTFVNEFQFCETESGGCVSDMNILLQVYNMQHNLYQNL